MAQEFGRRRPAADAQPAYRVKSGGLSLPSIDPMQIAYGIGFCLVGYVLGMSLFGTLLPQPKPEFLRFVYVPAETRTDLINDSFEAPKAKIVMPGKN
jgi:hypothetical protein